MNGLWKDFPQKVQKHLNEVRAVSGARRCCARAPAVTDPEMCACPTQRGWNIAGWCVAPTAAVMWYGPSPLLSQDACLIASCRENQHSDHLLLDLQVC